MKASLILNLTQILKTLKTHYLLYEMNFNDRDQDSIREVNFI